MIETTHTDNRITTIEQYTASSTSEAWFSSRYGNNGLVNEQFYSEHNYIYKYTENLNLKPENAQELPTGIIKNAGINRGAMKEIIAYELSYPYIRFNINFGIGLLNKGNVIQQLLRYLTQFQQLNYTYNDYDLNGVYDDVVIRIQHQRGLMPNYSEIKDSLLDKATTNFHNSIKGKAYSSIREVVKGLGLGKLHYNYVYSDSNTNGASLLLKALKRKEMTNNTAKVNDCIDEMMNAQMYIDLRTIGEQLFNSNHKVIERVFKDRKQEIKKYNLSTLGVASYKKYVQNYLQ